jgi:hypothetical protein
MKCWCTKVKAIDWRDGQLKEFGGPNAYGINKSDAEKWLWDRGLGMWEVDGELVMEIPCKKSDDGYEYNPDWDNAIDYEQPDLN